MSSLKLKNAYFILFLGKARFDFASVWADVEI